MGYLLLFVLAIFGAVTFTLNALGAVHWMIAHNDAAEAKCVFIATIGATLTVASLGGMIMLSGRRR